MSNNLLKRGRYMPIVLALGIVASVAGIGALTALSFPLQLTVFLAVFTRSVVATARGSVSWRGRRLPTRVGRRP